MTSARDWQNYGVDQYGHGTHLAGIVAGSGAGSRTDNNAGYIGMAPGAAIISEKVLDENGIGYVSDVIEAIDWTIENRLRFNIRVINLSLGHHADQDWADDPLAQAVERAVRAGLVVPAAAGNQGKTADGTPVVGAVISPGFDPLALTVGALNTHGTVDRSDDTVATFSSRGPVGDRNDSSHWVMKPDMVAPGNAIVAAGVEGSTLWKNYPALRVMGARGEPYLMLSGTSQATAVVSGAVALLLQAAPNTHTGPSQVRAPVQRRAPGPLRPHRAGRGQPERAARDTSRRERPRCGTVR